MTVFVLCIPFYLSQQPPPEQKNCVLEPCPRCNAMMWVSEKKRAIRETDKSALVLCGICVIVVAREMGMNPKEIPLIDINKTI